MGGTGTWEVQENTRTTADIGNTARTRSYTAFIFERVTHKA